MTCLRDYQRRAVEQVCLAAKRGQKRVVVCQPVGSGKTEVQAELCRIARYPVNVVPLVDLMRQNRDRMELRLGEKVDIEQELSLSHHCNNLDKFVYQTS